MKPAKKIVPDFFSAFFMFPFGIRECSGDKIKKLRETFSKSGWILEKYDVGTGFDYNEYVYFYPYIWDILFTADKVNQKKDEIEGVHFFRYSFSNNHPRIVVQHQNYTTNSGKHEIQLAVKNVFLHLFPIGVGILIFEIIHQTKGQIDDYSLQDLLFFTNGFRRIYPPFIFSTHRKHLRSDNLWTYLPSSTQEKSPFQLTEDGIKLALGAVNKLECAEEVILEIDREKIENNYSASEIIWSESEKYYKPNISLIIRRFLDNDEFSYKNGDYSPIIDDRMFVHSFYSINPDFIWQKEEKNIQKEQTNIWNIEFIQRLKRQFQNSFNSDSLDFSSDVWYQMIHIDWGAPTCANKLMQSEILKACSYGRWSDWGTFYGFSRFSSVTLTNINAVPFLYNHFQSLYYQIAVLLLFYRGALLNFSDRSERLSKEIHQLNDTPTAEMKNILRKVETLHRDFLLFRNRYWFREVTAQDQGIEIFDIWNNQLRNKELMEDIQLEIKELFGYVDTTYEKTISKAINILTVLGAVFFPLAIITGLYGINAEFGNLIFKFPLNDIPFFSILWSFIVFITLFYLAYQIMKHIFKDLLENEKYEPLELKELLQKSLNAFKKEK